MSVYFEVYEIVKGIPRGRILTYGLISNLLEKRLSAQGVGWALRALSSDKDNKKYHSGNVPWHRVINSTGGISTSRISTSRNTEMPPDLQQSLLEEEGIVFNSEGKLDMQKYLWAERLLSAVCISLLVFSLIVSLLALPAYSRPTPEQALQELKRGNKRYLSGKTNHFEVDSVKREMTAVNGQKPVAIVLGCSDSRVPVEMVFDQGLAELFVVRVAGNVCATSELASIEYGIKYLGIPLVIVLGHSDCGAVKAAVDSAVNGSLLPGNLPTIMSKIAPAVAAARKSHPSEKGEQLVHSSAVANVWLSANDMLSNSSIVKEAVFSGKVKIIGAMRDLKSGTITFLGEYPQPARLMTK
ncbi:MAG: carbonic anhydrase [Candidatus Obscuribacterales bacterium]